MKNKELIVDHLTRAEHRLAAIEVLRERKSWADVVRESQEVVELSLKALLRAFQIEVPRIHDVSKILLDQRAIFPKGSTSTIEKCAKISHQLRRDRELAFYGSEDLTPSEFYQEDDGEQAFKDATWLLAQVKKMVVR